MNMVEASTVLAALAIVVTLDALTLTQVFGLKSNIGEDNHARNLAHRAHDRIDDAHDSDGRRHQPDDD